MFSYSYCNSGLIVDINNLLKIATKYAIISGQNILVNDKVKFTSNGKDIKSSADIISEETIITHLQKNSPYSILSEESEYDGKIDKNDPYWIIDPLDGTMNYTRNFPMACIAIALWENNEPILGVVYDFNKNETYSAIIGRKAYRDNHIISVSNTDSIQQSILATGFPVKREYDSGSLVKFVGHVQKFKKIRMIGSAALSLSYVASGIFDAYYEEDIMIWDVAAGLALVKAAGGDYIIKPGNKMHSVICAATNGKIPISALIK